MDAAAQAHNALANEHETDLLGIVSATVVVVSFSSIFFVCVRALTFGVCSDIMRNTDVNINYTREHIEMQ